MKKYTVVLTLIFLSMILGGGLFVSHFIAFNQYKKVFQEYAAEKYNIDVNVKNDVHVVFLPHPYLSLDNVSVRYRDVLMLYAKNVQIKISLRDLFTWKTGPNVEKIIFNHGILSGEIGLHYLQTVFSEKKLTTYFMDFNDLEISTKKHKQGGFKNLLHVKSLQSMYNEGSSLALEGIVGYNNAYNHISFDISDVYSSVARMQLVCKSDRMTASFVSNNFDLENFSKMYGTLSVKLKNAEILPNALIDEKNNKDELVLYSDVTLLLPTKTILFSNFSISSNAIENLKGKIFLDVLDSGIEIRGCVSVKKLNFDVSTATKQEYYFWQDIMNVVLNGFNMRDVSMLNNVTAAIDFSAEKIVVANEVILNTSLSLDIFKGVGLLNALSAELPGSTAINLWGTISHNSIRPKFIGNVNLKSKNFAAFVVWSGIPQKFKQVVSDNFSTATMTAKIYLIPSLVKLFDIEVGIGGATKIQGVLKFAKTESQTIAIYSTLYVDKINLDKLQIGDFFDHYFALLYAADSDKSGEAHFKLLNNYMFLRTWAFPVHLKLVVDRCLLKTLELRNISTEVSINSNNFRLANFSINTELLKASGDFSMSLPTLRPKIVANIKFEDLDLQVLAKLFPTKEQLSQDATNIINTTEFSNIDIEPTPHQNFNFFSMAHYDGKINVSAGRIKVNQDINLEKLNFALLFNNGVISLKEMKANAFNGSFVLAGNAIISETIPRMDCIFSLNSINPNRILHFITGLDKINGYMNINGVSNTYGNDMPTLRSNLDGNIIFAGKMITWNGFNLDSIVALVDSEDWSDPSANIADAITQVNSHFDRGSSLFDDLQGSIKIQDGVASMSDIKIANNRLSGIFAANYDVSSNFINSIAIFSFMPVNGVVPLSINLSSNGQLSDKYSTKFNAQALLDFIGRQANSHGDSVVSEPSTLRDRLS